MSSDGQAHVPGAFLLHPVALLSLGAWALNDHLMKGRVSGAVTGKLSDVACLVAFPLLLAACVELCAPQLSLRARRTALLASALTGAAVMAAINTLDPAAEAYRWGLGMAQWPLRACDALIHGLAWPALRPVVLTMDPTDLWTLPAAAVAAVIGWPRGEKRNVMVAPARPRQC